MTVRLVGQPYSWEKEEPDEGEAGHTSIRAWCLDRESKPFLLRFENYGYTCQLELPRFIKGKPIQWTRARLMELATWLKNPDYGPLKDDLPLRIDYQLSHKLYYYRGGNDKYPFLTLTFATERAARRCERLCKKAQYVPALGFALEFKVWELNIDMILKMLTERNCGYSQWFEIEATPVERDVCISSISEYTADWQSLTPLSPQITKSWVTHPRVLAFDIETYSDNHRAFPNRWHTKHVAYMVSAIYQQVGKPETRKRYGILLGECEELGEFATIYKVQNEIELVERFARLIQELDPEIISGYNILDFDYKYLDARIGRVGVEWPAMGRIPDRPSYIKTKTWQSSAYGHNELHILQMSGRISIDMLPLIKRDHKLDKYDLDFVSRHFLGETKGKHDVKAKEMFEIYEENQILHWKPEVDVEYEAKCQKAISNMTRVLRYCIQDAELVVDLMDQQKVWTALIEMSNIVSVSIMDLFTRGQQVRCESQIYREIYARKYVMDRREASKVAFSGGFVYEPIPGLYENVICLDFASLYPSIMQAMNICHSTLVAPECETEIPDEDCNVIEFDQEEEDLDNDEDETEEEKTMKITIKHYRYKFVKANVRWGILPQLVKKLVEERRAVRKQLDGVRHPENPKEWIIEPERDPITRVTLDKRQLALKVSANSMFGFLGAQSGRLPLIEGARSITAMGRQLIGKVNDYLASNYKAKIVYNDSVSKDTPLLIRRTSLPNGQSPFKKDNQIMYKQISDLIAFNEDDNRYDGKQERNIEGSNIEVWSDNGWTRIKRVIRHKTGKQMYRIYTGAGEVDVTEDHSLLNEFGELISPKNVVIGTKLLHKQLPYDENIEITETNNDKIIRAYEYFKQKQFVNEHSLKIVKIEKLGLCDDYVYDLETENHHFGAGIGCMIVHNTDSSMVDLGIQDAREANRFGHRLSQEISGVKKGQKLWDGSVAMDDRPGLFPPPLAMEFEKAMRLLCLKKKKYAAYFIKEDGSFKLAKDGSPEVLKRGIVLARRDNSKFLRKVYNEVLLKVLNRKSLLEAMEVIISAVNQLLKSQISYKDLLIVREVGSYDADSTYFMKVFADELRRIGKPVRPGDRIEYLIANIPGISKIGQKMQSLETYLEKQEIGEPFDIDYYYYIEKQLKNAIDQLISIGYQTEFQRIHNFYGKEEIGYTPKGRKQFIPVDQPIKMISAMILDGQDVSSLLEYYRKVLEGMKPKVKFVLT